MITYSIRLNGVKCGAPYCVTRPDREGEDAHARTQHSRVFHKPRFYHSAEYCTYFLTCTFPAAAVLGRAPSTVKRYHTFPAWVEAGVEAASTTPPALDQ